MGFVSRVHTDPVSHVIVLVDDSVADAVLTELALQRSGHGTALEVLRRGEDALVRLLDPTEDQAPPSVVILDIKLPGISGHDVLEKLRACPDTEQVPVVMFSSSLHPADRARSAAGGASEYMTKPYGLARYEALVRQIESRYCA